MTANATERPQTRYLIYRTENQGRTLTLIGEQLANSSDQAIRKHLPSGAPEGSPPNCDYTAINENACKLRRPNTTVQFSQTGAPQLDEAAGDQLHVVGMVGQGGGAGTGGEGSGGGGTGGGA